VIVDTSAIIAILRGEPDADRYIAALAKASQPRMSAGTFLETAIVVDANRDPVLSRRLDELLAAIQVHVETVSLRQVAIARDAYRDFGKGRHPAALNFGDCFAYALAKETGEPMLYKGDDFARTDVASALDNR
jgi:ribonuclease VapC